MHPEEWMQPGSKEAIPAKKPLLLVFRKEWMPIPAAIPSGMQADQQAAIPGCIQQAEAKEVAKNLTHFEKCQRKL